MFFRIFVLILIVAILGVGLLDYLSNFEKNGCEMTYMFLKPQYLKVKLDSQIKSKFPRYGLYFYGEGPYAETVKKTNFRLSGIPVLFIPGNAGSYRQVRSLGSLAMNKAQDSKSSFHFNYFSIDFDEEYSAFFGQLLYDEAEFTHACIKKILSLYKGAASPPKSVVLVGHSMGGMVARSLFMLADFKSELVNTIITQATPHQMPPISFDPVLVKFYDEVNSFWKTKENTTLADVTVFSTGGGYRDVLVRSQLTSLNGLVRRDRSVTSNTMSVPGAWVSTDHLCHVWCKQIVLATQRALFDIIDQSTKQVAVSPFYRVAVFLHHFIKNPGSKKFKGAYDKTINLDKNITWEIRKRLSWKLWAQSLPKVRYSVTEIPTLQVPPQYAEPQYGYVAISNVENDQWLGVCSLKDKLTQPLPGTEKKKNSPKQCSQLNNQAQYADQLPPAYSDKKVIHIDPDTVKENTHIVTILPHTKKQVEFYSELYRLADRHLVYNTTGVFDLMRGFPHSINDVHVIINKTQPAAVFYNISLNYLDIPLQAYTAHLTSLDCTEMPPASASGAILKLHIPWAHEHTYTFIRANKNGSIAIKLMTPRPVNILSRAQLHLYLLPTCTYRLTITIAWRELIGQFVRFYAPNILGFLTMQVIMVLSWQMKSLDEQGNAPSFTSSHVSWAQPWRVVPVALMLRFMLYYPEDNNMADKLGLPRDDRHQMEALGIWYAALPVFLYLSAHAIMGLYAIGVNLILASLGRMFANICSRFHDNTYCTKLIQKSCYVIYLAAFVVSIFVCGTLGIFMIYAVTIIKTVSFYVRAHRASDLPPAKWSSFNVYTSLTLLLLLAFLMNVPSLLAWEKGLKFSLWLIVDPSRTTGAVVSVVSMILSLVEYPKYTGEMYGIASAILYMMCVVMTLFVMSSVYLITVYICTALIVITSAVVLSYWMERKPIPVSAIKQQKDKSD